MSVLVAFVRDELPLVALVRQFVDPGLKFGIGAKLDKDLGSVGGKGADDRFHKTIEDGAALLHAGQHSQGTRARVAQAVSESVGGRKDCQSWNCPPRPRGWSRATACAWRPGRPKAAARRRFSFSRRAGAAMKYFRAS